jgi:aminoglycoside 3-N-acetyltransferase
MKLGLSAGQTVMLHASVKAVGWVVGGPDIVIQSILDVLESEGTLMMYIGWEDSPYDLKTWSDHVKKVYLEECPPFKPDTSRAYRRWSILTEYLRTWPDAHRSSNPEASCASVGKLAQWITKDHPLQYGYGPGSPLAKLCKVKGKVLLLGAPLNTITLLHYVEHLADLPNKRVVHYEIPLLREGKRVWVSVEEYETCKGITSNAEEYFQKIVKEYLSSGEGCSGLVGAARSYLFDADDLTRFAKRWLETTFANTA